MAYIVLEQLSRISDGYMKVFQVGGESLLLIQEDGRLFLIENRCPHMDVSLSTGELLPGYKIRCKAHGIEFDLMSGKADGPLANTLDCLKKYDLVYEGNTVGIDL